MKNQIRIILFCTILVVAVFSTAQGAFQNPPQPDSHMESNTLEQNIIEIFPGNSFENAVESLQPNDLLIVHEGTYADSGRISINVIGTAQAPVVVMGAEEEAKPHITRLSNASVQNTINIEGATYLTIKGLEITSNGGDGIKMTNEPAHITLADLDIHDVDVGINFKSDMHHITVRHNHIYHTGTNNTTGEGMYVGCNYATCAVSDSLIEGNWIHDTLLADQGDGIEIKRGSHSNIIRDNVIYDTHWPCILLYGTEGNPPNLVEGNVMWNCGDSGIQVAADATVRNNIILESPANGLNSQDHQEVTPQNLEVVHNTIVGGDPCLRMHNWSNKPGMVFANNAVYCDSGNFKVFGLTGVSVAGNVIYPSTGQIPSSGYIVGRSTNLDFLNPAQKKVYPSPDSPLINAGDLAYVTPIDFNGFARTGAPDAGAYTWTGPINPGWQIGPGFKGIGGAKGLTLSITANPPVPSVNTPISYMLNVENANILTDTNVVLTNTLPMNIELAETTTTQGTCASENRAILCDLGNFPHQHTVTVTISVTPTVSGVYTYIAQVAGDLPEPDPSDNTVSLTLFVFEGEPVKRFLPRINTVSR